MDLTSQWYVEQDLSMVRPGAPADVRLLVQLQNRRRPAVLIDFVNVLECAWSHRRNVDSRQPEAVDADFTRFSILEFSAVAGGLFWLPLDERALGEGAARHRRASGA